MHSSIKIPLILIVAVLLASIAVYLALESGGPSTETGPDTKPKHPPTSSMPATPPQTSFTDAPPPSRPDPVPPPISSLPKQERPGAKARRIISQIRSGAREADIRQVFVEADGFQENGEGTDAHLLYFYAAQNGHPGAMFALATAYDPLHFQTGNSAMDDPTPDQAYKWYRQAAGAGNPEAVRRLEDLKRWVAASAEKGDRDAQQLLERW